MPIVAALTLGCKVNQYDTRAMIERFIDAGYTETAFEDGGADVALINTCTVTAVGDQKSRQAIRKARRLHPGAAVIISGCLAQRDPGTLAAMRYDGVRLVLGTQRRAEVVTLLEEALRQVEPLVAVDGQISQAFEPLTISAGGEGRTRATLKIEEGCDAHCTYCIVPSVRGKVRSRPVDDIRSESLRLVQSGYLEVVVTGINMSAYGKDLTGEHGPVGLSDALETIADSGIKRIRLSSLEPGIVTDAFVQRIARIPALCPHFPLALQSGSDAVLKRMSRGYTSSEYMQAVERLRETFADCAITTDVLTGFPGETDEQFEETVRFVEAVGFARLHVFPYSSRDGTPAARLPGQLTNAVKAERARILIELGRKLEQNYMQRMIGRTCDVLWERAKDGETEGYTPEYVRVYAQTVSAALTGTISAARLKEITGQRVRGVLIDR
ncbi:tRNA (N(6)-L-threonylcarbamoyladenosine(37)-C(2))- methylthiotransferase MtaB [Clostridia bacterium]|nr:tRNA (N(6)-L-threonylcarbamoyladenosine(37)-C(2))- methylthiotransferase MtaB [Clostridia bacterium]